MPANIQPTYQTEDADREAIFKLFQAIAAYGHRVRTGQKRFLLPENAESLSSVDEENHQHPDKRKEKSSEL